jgi:hypothetical protein
MALQKTVDVKNNFGETTQLTDCYIKVIRIIGDKDSLSVTVGFFKDSSQQVEYFNKVYGFQPNVDETSTNFIKQAYEHLKQLSDFAGSSDV